MKTRYLILLIGLSFFGCTSSVSKEEVPDSSDSTRATSLRENENWKDIILSEVPMQVLSDSFNRNYRFDTLIYFKLYVQRFNIPDVLIKVYQLKDKFCLERKVYLEELTPAEEYFEPLEYKDTLIAISSVDFRELKAIFDSFGPQEFSYIYLDKGSCIRGAMYNLYIAKTFGDSRSLREWYIPRLTLTPVSKKLINWFAKYARLDEINEPIIF